MEIFPKVNLDQYTPPPMVYTAVCTRIHKISAKCVDPTLYFWSYNNHSHIEGIVCILFTTDQACFRYYARGPRHWWLRTLPPWSFVVSMQSSFVVVSPRNWRVAPTTAQTRLGLLDGLPIMATAYYEQSRKGRWWHLGRKGTQINLILEYKTIEQRTCFRMVNGVGLSF